ncbi:MAG TPA: MerR family transcriptional regulator, partial [Piscinibacter sp.]|nr:MerR family transcriptional regulator [Piscinibacter sp.]
RSVLMVDAAAGTAPAAAGAMIPARRYSEETLARVAAISSQVLCECPRHVADLIAQLASFEQYSQECLNRSAEDAHLHAHLASISGTARALFEAALEKIALHEGIALG